MLSSQAKYAVRALVFLARRRNREAWAPACDIATTETIPRKFLEAIMVQLRNDNLVESRRGARGGHRLARDPAAISLANIIRVIDGPLALTPCASVTDFHPCTDCADIATCHLRNVMRQTRDAVADVLENCSIADLAADNQT